MDRSFPTFRRLFADDWRLLGWWPWYTTAAQQRSLLRVIAVGVEENLSLIPLLESWADDEHGIQRVRLRRLIRLLQQGRTLPDAIEAVPSILREEDVLAVRFDAQSGTRTDAIRQALAEQDTTIAATAVRIFRPIVYFCVVLPVGLLITAFIQTKILPVLQNIFAEFETSSPRALQWSADWSNFFANGGWLVLLAAILGCLFLLFTRKGRQVRRSLFGRMLRPQRRWHVADVLQKIALASRAGRPVAGALSTLARYHFDPLVRQELLFVRNEMEQGADIWNSMATVGMLTTADVRALQTAERIGNGSWVLNELAEVKKRRTSRSYLNWSELVLPALVLLMALFVLFQALTVFEPLTKLIQDLA